ncbi:hypothetical protein P9112_002287 [Eukaryota sp. TZLM1-RC]
MISLFSIPDGVDPSTMLKVRVDVSYYLFKGDQKFLSSEVELFFSSKDEITAPIPFNRKEKCKGIDCLVLEWLVENVCTPKCNRNENPSSE